MAISTFLIAKSVAITDYMPAFRAKEMQQSWDWQKAFTMKTMNRATEQVFGFTGLPAARQTKELEPTFYANFSELGATTFTANKFTLASMISHEAIEDNIHLPDLMSELGDMQGESHAFVKDQAVAAIFNRAFSSTNQAMYDSAALCATHTMKSGDTLDNALTASSITYDNVWSAVNHFETTLLAHNGLYLTDKPEYLLYHPSKEKEVQSILKSSLEPGTANNDKNTLLAYGLKPLPCRFLTTSTNWFILGSRAKKDLLFFTRAKVQKEMEDDFDRHGVKIKTWQRFAVGVRDFIYILGNPGA